MRKYSVYESKDIKGLLCLAKLTRSSFVHCQFVKDHKGFTMPKIMFKENFVKHKSENTNLSYDKS